MVADWVHLEGKDVLSLSYLHLNHRRYMSYPVNDASVSHHEMEDLAWQTILMMQYRYLIMKYMMLKDILLRTIKW